MVENEDNKYIEEYSRLRREAEQYYKFEYKDPIASGIKWGVIAFLPIGAFMSIARLDAPKFNLIAFFIGAASFAAAYYMASLENSKNYKKIDDYIQARISQNRPS